MAEIKVEKMKPKKVVANAATHSTSDQPISEVAKRAFASDLARSVKNTKDGFLNDLKKASRRQELQDVDKKEAERPKRKRKQA